MSDTQLIQSYIDSLQGWDRLCVLVAVQDRRIELAEREAERKRG